MHPGSVSQLPRLSDEWRERYEADGVWGDETFDDRLRASVDAYPDSTITGPNQTLTATELGDKARRLASGLQQLGVGPGDVVSYQLPNHVSTVVVHAAISLLGAVANPIITIYRHQEVEYMLNDGEPSCLFVPGEYNGFDYPKMVDELDVSESGLEVVVVGDADYQDDSVDIDITHYESLLDANAESLERPSIDANDIHALLYTSGTTADPKGVLHTHNTLLFEELTTIDLLGLSSETSVFMPSPVTHITGLLYALEMPFLQGMDLVLMDDWDSEVAVELIDEHRCNMTIGATPFLQGITDEAPADWNCPLRIFGCGGAEVPPDLVRQATEKLGCTVQRLYGSTEYPTVTWPPLDAPHEKLAETDGPPAPGCNLKIVDLDTGETVPAGERGEIWTHGPELMVGYLGDDLNEASFEGEWFKTGDIAIQDEDGYIEITGRKKDIIVRGGENISVKEVEDCLFKHPAIKEVAVVAMPDPKMQEKGCAYVRLNEGSTLTMEEMVSFLEEQHIAKQKFPEALRVVEEFPMTASGKIQKNVLRERIAEEIGMEPITRD